MSLANVLVVQLDPLTIGLYAAVVQRILSAAAIAPLPAAPRIIEGVLNVHGELVPVLDVRARFGLRPVELHPDQHFVVAKAGPRTVALRVDRALDVVEIPLQSLKPADEVIPGVPHVSAVARTPDGVLLIHDLDRFLSLDEEHAIDQALAAASAASGDEVS